MTKLANLRSEWIRAREQIKMFIPGSCDIGFLCSNMRIEAKTLAMIWNEKVKILKLRSRDMTKIATLTRELRGALE